MSVILDLDVREALPMIQAPTLILHAKNNGVISVDHGRYLAAHIPGAKYVELPGDEHALYGQDENVVLAEIREFLTGVREAPVTDRVLATILFTDIVGSTERAVELGDQRWRDLLDRHDEAARGAVARFSGKLVKTTGDGVLATFDGPARAIEATRAIVNAARGLGLEIRAGLHTGEPLRLQPSWMTANCSPSGRKHGRLMKSRMSGSSYRSRGCGLAKFSIFPALRTPCWDTVAPISSAIGLMRPYGAPSARRRGKRASLRCGAPFRRGYARMGC
jgi:hypothetical protein